MERCALRRCGSAREFPLLSPVSFPVFPLSFPDFPPAPFPIPKLKPSFVLSNRSCSSTNTFFVAPLFSLSISCAHSGACSTRARTSRTSLFPIAPILDSFIRATVKRPLPLPSPSFADPSRPDQKNGSPALFLLILFCFPLLCVPAGKLASKDRTDLPFPSLLFPYLSSHSTRLVSSRRDSTLYKACTHTHLHTRTRTHASPHIPLIHSLILSCFFFPSANAARAQRSWTLSALLAPAFVSLSLSLTHAFARYHPFMHRLCLPASSTSWVA